jgi:hypothetical protein
MPSEQEDDLNFRHFRHAKMSLQVKGMSLPVHPFHSPETPFMIQRRSDCQIHPADLQIPRYPSAAFEMSLRQNVIVGDDIFITFNARDF